MHTRTNRHPRTVEFLRVTVTWRCMSCGQARNNWIEKSDPSYEGVECLPVVVQCPCGQRFHVHAMGGVVTA